VDRNGEGARLRITETFLQTVNEAAERLGMLDSTARHCLSGITPDLAREARLKASFRNEPAIRVPPRDDLYRNVRSRLHALSVRPREDAEAPCTQ